MQQLWHIFKKDARSLTPEIVIYCLLALMLTLAERPDQWDAWEPAFITVLAGGFLIGRVIHREPLTRGGSVPFWATRPYRWDILLGAKIAFIVLFVSVPLFLMDTVVLLWSRYSPVVFLPRLVWMHAEILSVGIVVAALVAILPGSRGWLRAAILIALLGTLSAVNTVTLRWRELLWVPDSYLNYRWDVLFALLFVAGTVVIALGYFNRRPLPACIALILAAPLSGYLFLAFGVSARVAAAQAGGGRSKDIQVARVHSSFAEHKEIGNPSIDVETNIENVPEGYRTHLYAVSASFKAESTEIGPLFEVYNIAGDPSQTRPFAVNHTLRGSVETFRNSRKRGALKVTLYFDLFRVLDAVPLKLYGGARVIGPDGLRCAAYEEDGVACGSAVAWPENVTMAVIDSRLSNMLFFWNGGHGGRLVDVRVQRWSPFWWTEGTGLARPLEVQIATVAKVESFTRTIQVEDVPSNAEALSIRLKGQ